MSIFGNIVSAIFGHGAAAPGAPAAKGTPTVAGPAATGKPMTREQVEEMIEKLADAQHEKYNWEESCHAMRAAHRSRRMANALRGRALGENARPRRALPTG
jgi:hypothetical protein